MLSSQAVMLPLAAVEPVIGRAFAVGPDAQERAEGVERIEAGRGIVGRAAEYQFERFKSHHGAKGSVFASWDQAWQTWVLNQARFNGTAPTTRPANDGMDGRI